MSKFKKPIIYLTCFFLVLSSVIVPYYNTKAAEAVVVGGLSAAGVALLGLGAICGVGMELDNNRRFNELSDEEKQRIENGLATNFEDVALQRGASIEHIKDWTTELCNGVLDKASECWGIFKDWVKNINLSETSNIPLEQYQNGNPINIDIVNGISGTNALGHHFTVNSQAINRIKENTHYDFYLIMVTGSRSTSYDTYSISISSSSPTNGYYASYSIPCTTYTFNLDGSFRSVSNNDSINTARSDYVAGIRSSFPVYKPDAIGHNINGTTAEFVSDSYFKTNTDYLEKLKGQDEDVIDVIDVTDIKNPIIESRPNSLANINWNRGTRRTNNNNDDDDNKMVTGLVPMDIWYEQIDDEQEEMQNAVVVYNNYIQQHPEEEGSYFISTTPITNINNYFNTLPVVNIPTQGTVVNNYYEYNNYNNNNTTIYELPYNKDLVPLLPSMFFENKFPFCIPWDVYSFISAFYVEKEAPKIDIPFPIKGDNGLSIETVTIDLSGYEYLSTITRVMFFVLFLVGLMLLTRQLIKG